MFSTASSHREGLGSIRNPIALANTSGIPKAINQYVYTVGFNDFDGLERTVRAHWGDLAAIFVEPMLGNSASIMPQPGFLGLIRELCDEYGIVMMFDEVKTGFRVANGGAQEFFGVQADLVTYAKAMGNGFPIAAIAGKEEVMMTVEPGSLAHGGTYSGNVVGAAAADKTLEILEEQPILKTIEQRGKALMAGIADILTEAGIPHYVTGVPTMFGILLGSNEKPNNFRDYLAGDGELYEAIGMGLNRRGIQPDSDGREPWFLCYSLSEEDVSETLNVFNDAVKDAKQG